MRGTEERFSVKRLNYNATRWPEKEQAEIQIKLIKVVLFIKMHVNIHSVAFFKGFPLN